MTFDEEQFLIHELADASGVSTRTIRYYIAEGLLPAPSNRGRYAYYQAEYLDRILLIKALQSDFLPLKEIRLVMEQVKADDLAPLRKDEDLRRQYYRNLRVHSPSRIIAEDDTAAGYIQNLIAPATLEVNEDRTLHPRPMRPPTLRQVNQQASAQNGWRERHIMDGVRLMVREDVESQAGPKLQTIIIALRQMFRLL